MENPDLLVSIACIVGFIGDALLQLFTKYFNMGGPTGWGLKEYFIQHGSTESLFVAGGMMSLFYVLYIHVLKLPFSYQGLAVYGILLDLLFRKLEIFQSLSGYYSHLNYFESGLWGAIPMILPYFIFSVLVHIIIYLY